MFYMFDDVSILDRVGEIYFDKFDPMLYEFSLFDNVKHDPQGYENKQVIVNYSQETNEGFLEYCSP